MAKQKESKRAVNKYAHNLNKHTIVTDANSFVAKGVRYLIYQVPTIDIDGILIELEEGTIHVITLDKYKKYV